MSESIAVQDAEIDDLVGFLRRYAKDDVFELAERYPNEQQSLTIAWTDLFQYDPDLAEDIYAHPDRFMPMLDEALRLYDLPVDVDLSGATVRIEDLPEDRVYDVGAYRSENVNELVGIRGVVSKQTQVEPKPDELAYECLRCTALTYIPQDGRGTQEPHECSGCERQGPWDVNFEKSTFHDFRLIRLQLPPDKAQGKSDDATIDVALEHDLVNDVQAGDRVVVTALLRAEQRDNNHSTFEIYAEANSVSILETDFEDVDVSNDEIERIQAIADNDPFSTLVRSFCPNVYGYEDIKEAIILQLFGGMTKPLPGGSVERGHSHIALIGDPGTTKSTMLMYATDIAPRSIFSSGKSSSASGLTAAAVRDDFGPGNEWTLEGGALVKADKGLACIDELDKADEDDRNSLHEALEQMTVSVSKAGINATLNARTTLLTAANPTEGRFDEYQPPSQQIDLDPALLSRFDLLFTFTDTPDEDTDTEIIEHKTKTWVAGAEAVNNLGIDDTDEGIEPDLEQSFVRKYIAHAKKTVHPVPSDDAVDLVEEEFMKLRRANEDLDDDEVVPVTFRKQEAIHRLAEASARVRLSDTVETQDVRRALRLIRRSLEDVGMDPDTGHLDVDRVETGTTATQRQRKKQIKAVIVDLDDGDGAELDEFYSVMVGEFGYQREKIKHDIETYKENGQVWFPKADERIAWNE